MSIGTAYKNCKFACMHLNIMFRESCVSWDDRDNVSSNNSICSTFGDYSTCTAKYQELTQLANNMIEFLTVNDEIRKLHDKIDETRRMPATGYGLTVRDDMIEEYDRQICEYIKSSQEFQQLDALCCEIEDEKDRVMCALFEAEMSNFDDSYDDSYDDSTFVIAA